MGKPARWYAITVIGRIKSCLCLTIEGLEKREKIEQSNWHLRRAADDLGCRCAVRTVRTHRPPLPFSFNPEPFFLPTMSTSKLGRTPELTQEEQILHHYAGMVKKDLQAYHASPLRDESTWRRIFKDHLVLFILAIHCYKLSADSIRRRP